MGIESIEFFNLLHLYFNMKHLFSRLSYSTRNCHNLYLLTYKVCCVWYSNTQTSVCDASVLASFRHRANGVKSLRTRGRTVLNKRIHNMNLMISLYYSNVFKHVFDIHVFVCISYSYQRKLVCVWKKNSYQSERVISPMFPSSCSWSCAGSVRRRPMWRLLNSG